MPALIAPSNDDMSHKQLSNKRKRKVAAEDEELEDEDTQQQQAPPKNNAAEIRSTAQTFFQGLHQATSSSNRKNASSDTLRSLFSSFRSQTRLYQNEEEADEYGGSSAGDAQGASVPGPKDTRIQLVQTYLEMVEKSHPQEEGRAAKGGARQLLDAWDMAIEVSNFAGGQPSPILNGSSHLPQNDMPTLLPLPIFVLSNIIRHLSWHYPTHALGDKLISHLLSSSTGNATEEDGGTNDKRGSYLQMLVGYIAGGNQHQHSQPDASGPRGRKGFHQTGAAAAAARSKDVLSIASLTLLISIARFSAGKHSPAIFKLLPWGSSNLNRLFSHRRHARGKRNKKSRKDGADDGLLSATGYDANSITPSKPDIRTLYILLLLSLLSASPSLSLSSSSSYFKLSLLSLEPSPYTALLRGLSADPAWLLTRTLRVYHQSLLSDSKVPRKTKIAVMGQTAALEALLACYARTEERVDLRTGLPISPSEEEGEDEAVGISVAQVVHHFLLALCTHPGFGIAFEGRGWYPRGWTGMSGTLQDGGDDQEGLEMDEDEDDAEHAYRNSGGYKKRKRTSLHNPVLYNFLRTISPTRSSLHSELVTKIVQACPELLGAWLPDNSTPANAIAQGDPRGASTAWIANAALVTSLLRSELPFDTPSLTASTPSATTEDSSSNAIKADPPPLSCTVSNVMPSPPLTKSILSRAIFNSKDRLLQHQALILLASALDRIARFARVCEHASEIFEEETLASQSAIDGERAVTSSLLDQEDREKIAPPKLGNLCNDWEREGRRRDTPIKRKSAARMESVSGRWTTAWNAVKSEGIRLLPDLSSLVTYIHDLQHRDKSHSEIILIEAASRCVWLYHEALLRAHPINAETFSLANSVRVDVGKLLQSPLLLPRPSSLVQEDAATPELKAFQTSFQLHTLRAISSACASDIASNLPSPMSFPSTSSVAFNIFSRFTTLNQSGQKETCTNFEVIIKLWLGASKLSSGLDAKNQGVRSACVDLLQTAFGKSFLFELNPDEWKLWMWALCPSEDGSTSIAAPTDAGELAGLKVILNMIEQSAQRCAKTLHRYMEASRALELIPPSGDNPKAADFSFSGGIPVSPLFMTVLEQFAIRIEKGLFDQQSLQAIAPFMSRLVFSFTAFGLREEIIRNFAKTCQDAFVKAIDVQSSAEGSKSAPSLGTLQALRWNFDQVLPDMLKSYARFEGNEDGGRTPTLNRVADDPFRGERFFLRLTHT